MRVQNGLHSGDTTLLMHLLDVMIWAYGGPLQDVARPLERITPPWKGNLSAALVSVQSLSYGALAEIYRERVFIHAFKRDRINLNWAVGVSIGIPSLFCRRESRAHDSAKESVA
jgi:hypothetical protein